MTKAELLDAVAKRAGTSKADAEKVIAAFFDEVVASTKGGDKVTWPGFGAFSTARSAAREARNPLTGGTVQIAAQTKMKFSAASALKASLNS